MRDRLARLGPYFAVDRPDSSDEASWRPLSVLLDSPAALTERVLAVRAALGGGQVEVRTAVSVAQLGLVARLVSPMLGVAVLSGRLLRLDPQQAWWQPVLGGPMPLAVGDRALVGVPYDGVLGAGLAEELTTGPVRALVELSASLSVSRTVLWGNVASAVNGAVVMVARSRPDLADAAATLGRRLLETAPLRGTSTGTVGGDFRRLSCCLIYRVAGPGPRAVCGDCVLSATT